MKRLLYIISLVLFLSTYSNGISEAFWVWTPESGKFVNPKYAVKETPADQLDFALEYYKSKDYKEAVRELKKLIKHYPKSVEAPEAQFYIGQAYENENKVYESFKQYQEVIDKYPFSERSAEIVEKQYNIGLQLLDAETEQEKGFFKKIKGMEYSVVDVFRTVIKNAPYGETAASSQYKIGLYLQERKMFQEARDEFEKVVNDYPDSEWSKAARYQIAVSDAKRSTDAQYDQRVTKSAVEQFEDFVEDHPDVELSKEARGEIAKLREKEAENNFVIAQFYEKQRNFKSAKIYYQIVVDDYKDSRWAQKSLTKIRDVSGKLDEKK